MEKLSDAMWPVLERMKMTAIGSDMPVTASRGDSALEERFWSMVDETDGGRKDSLDQFEIGNYRVDSIFLVPQGAVVIELDGAQYHRDDKADYRRDTEILRSVCAVIRVRYYDLMTFPYSTFYTIGRFYPRFHIRKNNFPGHDDPRTANMHGISWRQTCRKDSQIIERIKRGQRRIAA